MPRRAPPPPRASSEWAYFLDFDGTLIELAETPDAVHVDDRLRSLLARLHRVCNGAVALVSGRALAYFDRELGLPQLCIAGQHGLERRDPGGALRAQAPAAEVKREIAAALDAVLERHPTLLLEDKGMSLALHYRRAPQLAAYARKLMSRLAQAADAGLEVQLGKRVAEIKPAGIDKGHAVGAYLAQPPFSGRRPVYLGDDLTDECGFRAVKRAGGVAIKVGAGPSAADYRLGTAADARRWLESAFDPEMFAHA